MNNPLELLQSRHKEILSEYTRVYLLVPERDKNKVGHTAFSQDRESDLAGLKKIADEYDITIKILIGLNEFQYLEER